MVTLCFILNNVSVYSLEKQIVLCQLAFFPPKQGGTSGTEPELRSLLDAFFCSCFY